MGNMIRYEVDRSDTRYSRLALVKDGEEFTKQTVDVLVIQIDDGTRHVISFGKAISPGRDWTVKDGILKLYDEPSEGALRTYGRWTFLERVPYASVAAAEPELRSPSPQDFDSQGHLKGGAGGVAE